MELIRKVTEGKTLVMVEHDMGVVFGLADRISVLVYGQVIASRYAGRHPRATRRCRKRTWARRRTTHEPSEPSKQGSPACSARGAP